MVATTALVVAVLLAVSAFFSASETSIFSLESHRVAAMGTDGTGSGGTLARLREDPHRLLITVLVGNNVVNVAIASVTTAAFVGQFGPERGPLFATAVVSVLVLLLGEIIPKSYAVGNAESIARAVARPVRLLQILLSPIVTVFDAINEGARRLIGGARDIERPYVTREELSALVELAGETGVLDASERDLIGRLFRFNDVTLREVMVPHGDLAVVDVSATVAETLERAATERTSRLPVSDGERLVGHVDVRDLIDGSPDTSVREFLLPVAHAYEGREADDLLRELQERRIELAVVTDDAESVQGLVTIEDLLEELVGEVFDAGEPRPVSRIGPGRASVRGDTVVETVNDALGIELPARGDGSVADLLARELGESPDAGDSVTIGDARLTVRSLSDDGRVQRALVERIETK